MRETVYVDFNERDDNGRVAACVSAPCDLIPGEQVIARDPFDGLAADATVYQVSPMPPDMFAVTLTVDWGSFWDENPKAYDGGR